MAEVVSRIMQLWTPRTFIYRPISLQVFCELWSSLMLQTMFYELQTIFYELHPPLHPYLAANILRIMKFSYAPNIL